MCRGTTENRVFTLVTLDHNSRISWSEKRDGTCFSPTLHQPITFPGKKCSRQAVPVHLLLITKQPWESLRKVFSAVRKFCHVIQLSFSSIVSWKSLLWSVCFLLMTRVTISSMDRFWENKHVHLFPYRTNNGMKKSKTKPMKLEVLPYCSLQPD